MKRFLCVIRKQHAGDESWCGLRLMLSSALRCLRPSTCTLALTRQLTYRRPHMGPVETTIQTKLTQALKPEHLEVINESHMHAVPAGSESHFRVLVVSPQFEGLSLLQRHRLVNETLKEELSTCVHALAIQAKTPQQWSSNPSLAKSPLAWEDPSMITQWQRN